MMTSVVCRRRLSSPKPGPHQQQCRSNIVEATGNFVACCFDNFAVLGNIVEVTFDFVERTKFQRKTRSTLLPFLATKSNVASTLLLVWTGLNAAGGQAGRPPGAWTVQAPVAGCVGSRAADTARRASTATSR